MGVHEFLCWLQDATDRFGRHPVLRDLDCLLSRIRADYECSIVALFNGGFSLVWDLMRDVMEVDYLLRDFAYAPQHVADWLQCDEGRRINFYGPAALRERYAAMLGVAVADLLDRHQYRAHSQMLHVQPGEAFLSRGIAKSETPIGIAFVLHDMFVHAGELLSTLKVLGQAVRPSCPLLEEQISQSAFSSGAEAVGRMYRNELMLLDVAAEIARHRMGSGSAAPER